MDSFYSHISDPDILKAAGYIDHPPMPMHLDCFTTPLHHLTFECKVEPYYVLVATGSFSPLHAGHIHMMEKAKEALGVEHVVGGYFSPSHDAYVKTKGMDMMLAGSRIYQAEVAAPEWLAVDPWEACYNHRPINFTTVIERLEAYIRKHVQKQINVVFVFGSDNQDFAHAFRQNGLAICVARPGYPLKHENFREFERTLFTAGGIEMSSTSIRTDRKAENLNFKKKRLWMRNNHPQGREVAGLVRAELVSAPELAEVQKSHTSIVSADLWTSEANKQMQRLDISRVFDLGGAQFKAVTRTARPGFPPVHKQVQRLIEIIAEPRVLLDDDIATGGTVAYIKQHLPSIQEIVTLFHASEQYDIVDACDFVIGSPHGGLVVTLPFSNDLARVPYCLPFVRLSTRSSIDPDKEWTVSRQILNWNKEANGYQLLCDTDEYFQRFVRWHGHFSDRSTIADFCDRYLALFS